MFCIAKEVIIFPVFVPLINIILELFVSNSLKKISCKVIPPFHPWYVKLLVISKIGMVELWVELGWNFM